MGISVLKRVASVAVIGAVPLILPTSAPAITVTPTSDASDALGLANTLFLNVGGLAIESASLSGDFSQAGTYLNPQGTYGLPNTGIVLSSGNVSDYATGSNDSSGTSTSFGTTASAGQNALLGPITGQDEHFDVVQLDIEFFAPADVSEVTFFGAFGSEEWDEFVGSQFIDGFGLYVNGANVAGVTPTGGGDLQAVNINHPDMQALPGTELDGVLAPNGSPVLRFDVPVNAGATNQFQIILADASDTALDTTVYLSSFFAGGGGGATGGSEFDPLLPASNEPGPDGEFEIVLPQVPASEIVWVDPPVAVGYEYAVAGTEFDSITAPSLATIGDLDGYFVTVGASTVALLPGQTLDFLTAFGATSSTFTINGIDPTLGLDPANPLAFPLGVSFVDDVNSNLLTFTPLTEDVGTGVIPLPAGLPLYLGAMAIGGFVVRRGKRVQGA